MGDTVYIGAPRAIKEGQSIQDWCEDRPWPAAPPTPEAGIAFDGIGRAIGVGTELQDQGGDTIEPTLADRPMQSESGGDTIEPSH